MLIEAMYVPNQPGSSGLILTTQVGNAKLFGAEEDMSLSSQQWNTGLSVFFVTYALGGT